MSIQEISVATKSDADRFSDAVGVERAILKNVILASRLRYRADGLIFLVACAGSSSYGGGGGGTDLLRPGEPITVTGTSGSLTHSTTVTLTVQ
jgi:hypothetical protein